MKSAWHYIMILFRTAQANAPGSIISYILGPSLGQMNTFWPLTHMRSSWEFNLVFGHGHFSELGCTVGGRVT